MAINSKYFQKALDLEKSIDELIMTSCSDSRQIYYDVEPNLPNEVIEMIKIKYKRAGWQVSTEEIELEAHGQTYKPKKSLRIILKPEK